MNDSVRLVETVDRFCQFIIALPARALVEQDWGRKEVLAPLVYHHELYVKMVEAFLAGTSIAPPKGCFRDLNAEGVVASRGLTAAELVDRLQKANQCLIEHYRGKTGH